MMVCAGLAASRVCDRDAAAFDCAEAALDTAPRGAGLAFTRRRRCVRGGAGAPAVTGDTSPQIVDMQEDGHLK